MDKINLSIEKINFVVPKSNKNIEITTFFENILEIRGIDGNQKSEFGKELKRIIESDQDRDYYFIYSYELDISTSNKKYTTNNEIPIYIGKGNLDRTLTYKRDFQSLEIYKRLEKNAKIIKKVIKIIRSKKELKLNLNNVIDEYRFESDSISGEKPLFNKKDNGYSKNDKHQNYNQIRAYIKKRDIFIIFKENIALEIELDKEKAMKKAVKNAYRVALYKELSDSEKYMVDNFLFKGHKMDPYNFSGILEEFKVFNEEFSLQNFYEEFSKPYKKIKRSITRI